MCVSLFILFQLLYSGWINNDCGSNVYTKIIDFVIVKIWKQKTSFEEQQYI